MNPRAVLCRAWRALPLVALALAAGTGCVPGVAWLPDSRGLVYTSTDWPGPDRAAPAAESGRLVHFDLATKVPRVVAKTETATIQPAVSPDGRRVAVARVDLAPDRDAMLHVVLYDLRGKEVQRTKAFAWGDRPRGDVTHEKYAQLFWAPKGGKVLVHANGHTGICDLDRDEAVMLGAAAPMIYGTTPVRPDGTAFLITRPDKTVALVDWDGKPSAVAAPAGDPTGRYESILPAPAAMCWARWDGPVAVATWKGGQSRIDTARRAITVQQADEATWAVDGKEVQQVYTFPDGKTKLLVLYLMSYRDFRDAGLPTVRVDVAGPGPGQRRTLVPKAFHCGVYPSPSGELVALRYTAPAAAAAGRPPDTVAVVNATGEVVAEVDAGK
jgi:hypothetical protein